MRMNQRQGFVGTLFCALVVFSLATLLESYPSSYYYKNYHRSPINRMDPEAYQNVCEIVRGKHYPCEEHSVTTKDGYILGLQRVPFGRNSKSLGKPVLLVHGLLDSSHTWVDNLVNQSLAYILADEGYDVWLGNVRGNTYSRRHTSLDPRHEAFWKWSWDEMSQFDLPAMLNYVKNVTDAKKVAYIGHSQGTEIAFASLNEVGGVQDLVSLFVALGPVARLNHVTSPIKYIAPFTTDIEKVLDLFGHGEFLPTTELLRFLSWFLCDHHITSPVCYNVIFLICGFDKTFTNTSRIPVYTSHTPAGTSVQNIVHYSQTIVMKEFQHFDYGAAGNMEHYGQATPPKYGWSNITTPVALFYGGNDWLADPIDAEQLAHGLPNLVYMKEIPYYNHLDYVWAVNAAEVIYPDVLQLLSKYHHD